MAKWVATAEGCHLFSVEAQGISRGSNVTILLALLALFGFALLGVMPLVHAQQILYPNISISSASAIVGTTDTVSGEGFTQAGVDVAYTIAVNVGLTWVPCVNNNTVDSNGSFSCTFVVPNIPASGNPYPVSAVTNEYPFISSSTDPNGNPVSLTVNPAGTILVTATVVSTTTVLSSATTTITKTSSSVPTWGYGAMAAMLLVGIGVGFVIKKPPAKKP